MQQRTTTQSMTYTTHSTQQCMQHFTCHIHFTEKTQHRQPKMQEAWSHPTPHFESHWFLSLALSLLPRVPISSWGDLPLPSPSPSPLPDTRQPLPSLSSAFLFN